MNRRVVISRELLGDAQFDLRAALGFIAQMDAHQPPEVMVQRATDFVRENHAAPQLAFDVRTED
jgi:hypothetical protein